MIVSAQYACDTRLLVRVDQGSQVSVIPTLDSLQLWRDVMALVASGALTIADPFSPSDPADPAPSPSP